MPIPLIPMPVFFFAACNRSMLRTFFGTLTSPCEIRNFWFDVYTCSRSIDESLPAIVVMFCKYKDIYIYIYLYKYVYIYICI